jgi:DNA processing protein
VDNDLLYQLALTLIPNIGPVHAKILLQHFDAPGIFNAKRHILEKIEGIGTLKANCIRNFSDFKTAEEEIRFIEKYKITPLFITSAAYPRRLLNCYDSPILLYYKGSADLNTSRVISIIGTRNHSDYGKMLTEKLVAGLEDMNVTIISGLAYGIDALAHTASLKHRISTIGVLAHGLDQVYPPVHADLEKEMVKENGGLLTEFRKGTKPDRHNFPNRNRIVAGMSDATIVIETGIKGGSMITVELANGYNKDVFAFPGRTTDSKSGGCNYLIKTNKAILLTDAAQLAEMMGWAASTANNKKQKELFIEMTAEEQTILKILRQKETVHIDELHQHSGLSSSAVAAAILNLELQNVIVSLPGKLYRAD